MATENALQNKKITQLNSKCHALENVFFKELLFQKNFPNLMYSFIKNNLIKHKLQLKH